MHWTMQQVVYDLWNMRMGDEDKWHFSQNF